jgi:hypothetical protein
MECGELVWNYVSISDHVKDGNSRLLIVWEMCVVVERRERSWDICFETRGQ